MKAKFVRGTDPKEAMGIGDKETQDVQKIDKFLSSKGFKRLTEPEEDSEEHVEWIAEWKKSNKGRPVYLMWFYYPEGESYFFSAESWDTNKFGNMERVVDAEGTLQDILTPGVLENILAGEPMHWKIKFPIKESVGFKRGEDPKVSIGIGGSAFIKDFPYRVIKADIDSNYYIGGGTPVDNLRRLRGEIEVKFFTNPLKKLNPGEEYNAYEDYEEEDRMEYLESLFKEIGVYQLFDEFYYTDTKNRVRCVIKGVYLEDFVKEMLEDKWYSQRDYNLHESVNFERGKDPKAAMGIGKAGEENYFRDNLVGFPYKELIKRDGAFPWGDGNRILAKAAEMLEIPEKDVQIAVEYENEALTTSRIEEYIEDHEWNYESDDLAGEFELIKVGSGEIYVFEQGEQEDPYMILGSPF